MSTAAAETPLIAIVGNPNSGKTTLFNLLTGLKQKVANYPGVTVEKKIGECYSQHGKKLRLIDLPGAYSLNARSPDEAVLRDVLLGRRPETPRPDRVVCVVDSANIERNLYHRLPGARTRPADHFGAEHGRRGRTARVAHRRREAQRASSASQWSKHRP
jgi:energy-coupling factor transporter ATP-binding protein EcfA2